MQGDGRHDQTLAALGRLRAAVLADPGLADSLAEIWRPDAFAARAAAVAAERGVQLDMEEIVSLIGRGGRPRHLLQLRAPPPGWLPAGIVGHDEAAAVHWAFFGARRLGEPFFEQSLASVATRPFNRLFAFSTPLAMLAPPAGALAPAGFIFHMSRCGSTLAAQMLAACDANVVVSEAPPIDQLVRAGEATGLDEQTRAARLRAIVASFGRPRTGGERRLIIKLDSWHARALPLFRRAFPATPWAFLYRDPTEVLVSHMRRRGMQMIPELVAPAFLGIGWPHAAPDEDYAARVLAAICGAAASALEDGDGLAVNYAELPRALFRRMLPHFGIAPTADEAQAMEAAGGRDAKDPSRPFEPDSGVKQAEASEPVRRGAGRLADVYARLEAAHRSG